MFESLLPSYPKQHSLCPFLKFKQSDFLQDLNLISTSSILLASNWVDEDQVSKSVYGFPVTWRYSYTDLYFPFDQLWTMESRTFSRISAFADCLTTHFCAC